MAPRSWQRDWPSLLRPLLHSVILCRFRETICGASRFECITVGVTTEVALALIEATQAVVEASRPAGAQIPTAAIHILRDSTSYVVTWGSPEGYAELMVRAQLKNDGNPARPEDWQARMFEPKESRRE